MRRCEDAKMRSCGEGIRKSGEPKMRRCEAAERVSENLESRRCEDAQMRRCDAAAAPTISAHTMPRRCKDVMMQDQGNVHSALPVYSSILQLLQLTLHKLDNCQITKQLPRSRWSNGGIHSANKLPDSSWCLSSHSAPPALPPPSIQLLLQPHLFHHQLLKG